MKKISFRLSEELLDEIDTLAQLEGSDRTTIMKQALHKYLEKRRTDAYLKELAVHHFLKGHLNYRKLRLLLGAAEAVRVSKQIMDRGAELAQRLA